MLFLLYEATFNRKNFFIFPANCPACDSSCKILRKLFLHFLEVKCVTLLNWLGEVKQYELIVKMLSSLKPFSW